MGSCLDASCVTHGRWLLEQWFNVCGVDDTTPLEYSFNASVFLDLHGVISDVNNVDH